ncbi:MFS transporter [Microbacterium stercoris]|uniref:MFS transporter n=1 Tax=Microbacterium stercoris TaxID=2820289 RepID=A0A939QHD0_9MICO|nr:MFS transporter [Microbacterium stercoris]MBO3662959.1 MFS transporter [Microbacterium stercoris]
MTHTAPAPVLPRRSVDHPVAVVAVLAVAVLAAVSLIYITIPLTPVLSAEWQASVAAAAWIGAGFGLAFAAASFFYPALSDTIDPRWVITFGLVGAALATALAGTATDLGWMVAARVAQGAFAAGVPSVTLAYVARVLPHRHRVTGIAVISAIFPLASIAGQAYSLTIEPGLGWRWVFWILAILLVVMAAAIPSLPAVARAAHSPRISSSLAAAAGMFRRRTMWAPYLAAVSFLLLLVGMYAALQQHGAEFGIHDTASALAARLPGLPGIVLGGFAGVFIGRFGAYRVAAASFLLGAAGLAIEAAGSPTWLVMLGSGVFVAGIAVAIPAIVHMVGLASGPARGAGMAGYALLIGTGASLAPLAVAALAPLGFGVTVGAFAALMLVVAAAVIWAPRPAPAT